MKIVVNDIAAHHGGAMSVLKDFYHCVCENDTENEWIFLLGDKHLEERENIKVIALPQIKKSRWKRIWFDWFSGKKFIKKLNPDVVFSLQNTITRGLNVPQVVYLHQAIPFQKIRNFSFLKKKERKLFLYQHVIGRIIKSSLRKASHIIVQTEWMKGAVCEQCKILKEKVTVVRPTITNIQACQKSGQFNPQSFFYPTGAAMYKNSACLLDACRLLNAGNISYQAKLTLANGPAVDNVTFTGRLPREEVISEYNQSTLVFPSYIESCPFPLMEAKTMGGLILAADCPFAREVLQGYENAYFFPPFDASALAELMKKVISNEIEKKQIQCTQDVERDSWLDVLDIVKAAK